MEYYSCFKWNELSHNGKTWRGFKCLLVSERSQCEKTAYSRIPSIWHFGKGKIMESVKGSVVARVWVGKDEYREHRGFWGGQWDYSIWSMSLYIFFQTHRRSTPGVNPNETYFGWWWCISESSIVTYLSFLCWLWQRLFMSGDRGYVGTLISTQLHCEPENALK